MWEAPECHQVLQHVTSLSWRLREQRAEIHMEASPMWIVWESGDPVQMKTAPLTFGSAKSRGKAVLIFSDSFRQMDATVPCPLLVQTVLSPFRDLETPFLSTKFLSEQNLSTLRGWPSLRYAEFCIFLGQKMLLSVLATTVIFPFILRRQKIRKLCLRLRRRIRLSTSHSWLLWTQCYGDTQVSPYKPNRTWPDHHTHVPAVIVTACTGPPIRWSHPKF